MNTVPSWFAKNERSEYDEFLAIEAALLRETDAHAVVPAATVITRPQNHQQDINEQNTSPIPPPLPEQAVRERYGPGHGPFNGDIDLARAVLAPAPPGVPAPVTPGLAATVNLPTNVAPGLREQLYGLHQKTEAVRTARANILAEIDDFTAQLKKVEQDKAAFEAAMTAERAAFEDEVRTERAKLAKAETDFARRKERAQAQQAERAARGREVAALEAELASARTAQAASLKVLDDTIDQLECRVREAERALQHTIDETANDQRRYIEEQVSADRSVREMARKAEGLRADIANIRHDLEL